MRMLDLFAGRLGWSKAFLARGWKVLAIDLIPPPAIPDGCTFVQADVLKLGWLPGDGLVYCHDDGRIINLGFYDFICGSSPCEQFSVHGMKHFHPNPPYPELGTKLFNHTRSICEASCVPYVMENVRAAQQFVGQAVNHCGPFYLWGNAVPPLLPQGAKKGFQTGGGIIQRLKKMDRAALTAYRHENDLSWSSSGSAKRKEFTAIAATIPPELAACVADYAEALLREKVSA